MEVHAAAKNRSGRTFLGRDSARTVDQELRERDRLDPEEFLRGLANTLTGEAETFYRISRQELLGWTARAALGERDPMARFLSMLEDQFPVQTPERVSEFRDFPRRTGESLLAYYGRLVELAEDMSCHDSGRLVRKFLNGLHYELRCDVSVRVFDMGARVTLKEVYEVVKRMETGRRLYEIEATTDRSGEQRRSAWAATPAEWEKPLRRKGDERRCHNCGQLGHLRRDCHNPPACSTCASEEHMRRDFPNAPTCERCGRKGHLEKDFGGNRRARRKGTAMLAKSEEEDDDGSEASFALMARPARERDELGLRAWHRYSPQEQPTQERRDKSEERPQGAVRRHPLERMACQPSVLVVERGVMRVGGVKVKQAILDTGSHNVLIGAPMARLLGLDREDRVILEGCLLMTAEGGTAKWMPKTRSTVEIVIRPGHKDVCVVRMHCGISTSEDYDLLLGVEYLFAIGTMICMWEEKLAYQVTYCQYGVAERGAEWLCRGVEEINDSMIVEWGKIDLVTAGWSCRGYSRDGRGKGMGDERSAQFRDLVRLLKLIKKRQGEVTYIIENMDMADDPRPAVQAANEEITEELLGAGVAWDAA
ncbi:unnamed protein product [Closterium sp. NIES-53]